MASDIYNLSKEEIDEISRKDTLDREQEIKHNLASGKEIQLHKEGLHELIENIEDDEFYKVSKAGKPKPRKAPYAYGTYGTGKKLRGNRKEESINIVKAMLSMSKPAQRVFDILHDCMLDNDHVYGVVKMTSSKADLSTDIWQTGIKELIEKDFIRRFTPRGQYIISPKLIVPLNDPSVDYTLSNEAKQKMHKTYISTILSNWDKSKN